MIIVQLLILGAILIPVPIAVGCFFADVEKGGAKLPFLWISGQMVLWALFQIICVPFILKVASFFLLTQMFGALTLALVFGGIVYYMLRSRKAAVGIALIKVEDGARRLKQILWGIFGLLLLLQLILGIFLAYEEGDDAFYVAISTITVNSEEMYTKVPYTGVSTNLDVRHGLAPFPIWVAYLSKVTGMKAVTMAQIALPTVLIVMTYSIYYLIGMRLLKGKQKLLPLFMIFIAAGVLFGGYSTYSAENFLLVRTAQGKSVIANIVIPFLLYLLLRMVENLEQGGRIPWKYWLLVAVTMISGCLCSTLGALLTCMLLGVVGSIAVVVYRKWKLLFPMGCCVAAPVVYALLYFKLR